MTAPVYAQNTEHFEHMSTALEKNAPRSRERLLKTSIAPLDDIMGGLRSSTTTLLDSDARYASELLHAICVRALAEFDEEVIWIDGGNVIDPYVLSTLCKRCGFDRHEMLSMINVARAFTAYQLASLIDGFLGEEARKSSPSTIIISSISDMFMDNDVRRSESHQLLRRCADEIGRVTKECETVTVVTSHTSGRVKPEPKMISLLSDAFDVYMQMRYGRSGIIVRMPREGRATVFTPVPWNQMVLNDFMEEVNGENCSHVSPRP